MTTWLVPHLERPSFSGMAPHHGAPVFPTLWKACHAAWCPSLGPQGVLLDVCTGINRGTLMEGACYSRDGKGGLTVEFHGSNNYVDVGTAAYLDIFGANQDFSIACWAKFDDFGQFGGFFASGSSASNGIWFGHDNSGASPSYLRFLSRSNTVSEDSSANLTAGSWVHVSVTCDRDGDLVMYQNGVAVHTASISSTSGENWNRQNDVYKLGTDRSGNSHIDGHLDDWRLYSRVLTPREVWILSGFGGNESIGRGIAYRMHSMVAVHEEAAVAPTTQSHLTLLGVA